MSDWYFDDAMRMLERAREIKGSGRRYQVLSAMRQLISYLARRSPPRRTAINDCDGMTCDKCFRRTKDNADLCHECTGKKNIRKLEDNPNPERDASFAQQELVIHSELDRLKVKKPKIMEPDVKLTRKQLRQRMKETENANDILGT